MVTKPTKFNTWRLVGFCLLMALLLTGVVSAAPDKASDRQDKRPIPPTSYVFESPILSDVLDTAALTMQKCGCQSQVAFFDYEQDDKGWHRLTIYLTGIITPAPDAGIWEEIPFRGASLPDVLLEASKYMKNYGCDAAVHNLRYAREAPLPTDPPTGRYLHVVYLVLESPSPCLID